MLRGMAIILQTTFSNASLWTKMYEIWLTFHLSLSQGQINNIPALVQIMAWRRTDKSLSESMMSILIIHICTTQPQWVKKSVVFIDPKTYCGYNSMCYQGTILISIEFRGWISHELAITNSYMKLDVSTARGHLKSPWSLSGISLHLTLVTKWSRSHLTLIIQMSSFGFHGNRTNFWLRFSKFHIWPWKFKVKVMAKVKPDGHIWCL